MAGTADFIATVYDELSRLLNMTEAPPSMVMQMAWPGFSLSPADFRREETPTGAADPEVARETFSRLANIAPALNRARYENSGFEIDDLYELILSGAIPVGPALDSSQTSPVQRLFADAQFEFQNARRASNEDPGAFYYPATATPANWHEEAASQTWPTLSITSSQVRPPSPSSPFVKAGGPAMVSQAVWKLRPDPADSAVIRQDIQRQIAHGAQQSPPIRPGAPPVAMLRPLDKQARASLGASSIGAAARARETGSTTLPSDLSHRRPTDGLTVPAPVLKARPTSLVTRMDPTEQARALDLARAQVTLDRRHIANRFVLQQLVDQRLPTRPPSGSHGFSISFRYCRVNIERPWLKLALLNTRNWYMFGTAAGEYSSGQAEANPGMFPLLPVSFIAIRDLRITADWAQGDRQMLAQASSFGFFDIRNGTMNANTLEVKGLQILGWISRLMPQLPPLAPPAA